MRLRRSLVEVSTLTAVLGVLASCGMRSEPGDGGAVAVKVNGRNVSVSRVAAALERAPSAAAQSLERVIDQELLVQAALEKKLDLEPRVVQALENARRQILARAYLDSLFGAGEASPQEVKAFYEGNPALFARRRIYRFREVAVEAPAEKLQVLKDRVGTARNLDELSAWMKSHGVAFNIATATKPAEQLPLVFLPRLAHMAEGELAMFPGAAGASIVQLIESREAALSEQQAAPVIQKFLSGRHRLELAQVAIGKLREKASIEYVGEPHPKVQGHPQRGIASRTWAGIVLGNDSATFTIRGRN